ncbi:hypothetical protein TUSST3_15390 [Streptomyces sp. TUS-ST3]|nr:hypothetical protein TUSST3_15390 [Streptomyces sp. TUS-ST3]
MTERAPPSRIAVPNGGRITSANSLGPMETGAWLRAALELPGRVHDQHPAILAAVVLSTLPILVLYVIGRRQLIGGLTAGFGK